MAWCAGCGREPREESQDLFLHFDDGTRHVWRRVVKHRVCGPSERLHQDCHLAQAGQMFEACRPLPSLSRRNVANTLAVPRDGAWLNLADPQMMNLVEYLVDLWRSLRDLGIRPGEDQLPELEGQFDDLKGGFDSRVVQL